MYVYEAVFGSTVYHVYKKIFSHKRRIFEIQGCLGTKIVGELYDHDVRPILNKDIYNYVVIGKCTNVNECKFSIFSVFIQLMRVNKDLPKLF